ncbi:hypothetical protein ACWN8V_11230 [Vagococcus elongatus]|uniref:Uncharacterized protein n=1 Tax=Vagococcus elongatus TaxID=180344 RepID=A0A430AMQ6_9ENTE|nr:hypothetical protein [Vagococcus elongatus]RSU09440.1 hypothetical protein CBF29_11350 [Vagococcus elongatus]
MKKSPCAATATSTKVIIGVGVVAAVGAGIAIVSSKKVYRQLTQRQKKRELKQFVAENLGNNPNFIKIVDSLSPQEIETLTKVLEKVDERKKNIRIEGLTIQELKEEVKKMFVRLLDNFSIL